MKEWWCKVTEVIHSDKSGISGNLLQCCSFILQAEYKCNQYVPQAKSKARLGQQTQTCSSSNVRSMPPYISDLRRRWPKVADFISKKTVLQVMHLYLWRPWQPKKNQIIWYWQPGELNNTALIAPWSTLRNRNCWHVCLCLYGGVYSTQKWSMRGQENGERKIHQIST